MEESAYNAHQKRVGKSGVAQSVEQPPLKRPVARSIRASGAKSAIEEMLWEQMRHTLPTWKPLPERQYKYLHDRKFKADFAWPKNMAGYPPEMKPLAIEVQGMVHRVKKQFESDAVKHNTLTEAGWTIYYVTGKMIRSGDAIKLVERILA